MIGGPVGNHLDAEINAAIGPFPDSILDIGTGVRPPFVIKYMPARYGARYYYQPGQKLHISDTPGFTWGRATYVAPLAFPLSTGIFGRIGVIARFEPKPGPGRRGWRTFDATIGKNERLYLSWLQAQPMYREFALTAHSAYFSQRLRDAFRLNYDIDCVLFRPDQSNPRYTKAKSDVWMAVTDWRRTPGGKKVIRSGQSELFMEPRLTVVLEEEFEDKKGGIHRADLLHLSAAPFDPDLAEKCFHAYNTGRIIRIPS